MKWSFRSALGLAVAVHAAVYGAGMGWMAWQERRSNAMDIDLAHSSLLPPPLFQAAYAYKPPMEWYVGERIRLAPKPVPPPKVLPKPVPVEEEAAAPPPCPPPCPNNPSDWASSATAVQKPEWLDGMITDGDYPQEARIKNITGLVVVEVLLDTEGVVRDARLLQGADPLLNDETLQKLRASKFSPCVDGNGKPFPCTLRLPINWTLEE